MKIYEVWDEGFQKPFYLNVSKYTLAYVLEEVNKTISSRSLIFALAKVFFSKHCINLKLRTEKFLEDIFPFAVYSFGQKPIKTGLNKVSNDV